MFRHLRNWLFVLNAVQVLEASSWIPENNSVLKILLLNNTIYLVLVEMFLLTILVICMV